jgi:hypothetical protein
MKILKPLITAASLALSISAWNASSQTAPVFVFNSITNINIITNVAAGATPTVSNLPAAQLQFCQVQGQFPGIVSPRSCAVWPAFTDTAGASTNIQTYYFANSYDGKTVATSNYWSVTATGNGANAYLGYVYVPASNYSGAGWFAFIGMSQLGTNGITNAPLTITWPY